MAAGWEWSSLPPSERGAVLREACEEESCGLLDVRSPSSYERCHLLRASNFPLPSIRHRTAELPPQSARGLYLVAEPGGDAAVAMEFLRGGHVSSGRPSKGWVIRGVMESSEELWITARGLGLVECGARSRQLWSPSLHLLDVVPRIESETVAASRLSFKLTASSLRIGATYTVIASLCIASCRSRASCSTVVIGSLFGLLASAVANARHRWAGLPLGSDDACNGLHALDLGCGRGRDCIWLAKRGWGVVGVDNQSAFLQHLTEFASREQLASRVRCELRDLKKGSGFDSTLLQPRPHLINVSRFMSRKLLDRVVDSMPVGSVLAVHHFTREAVSKKSGRFDAVLSLKWPLDANLV
ncbi:MAG: hypothetical protein SGPRY_004900 [Prymnesium sp.]